ncbi:MAG: DEAD/DEAH box helicase, partial [Bacteroidota bacterium]|nr:DEAD/DEAH box helicase [Bacteroidota bacterium]
MQREIIDSVLRAQDTLALLPTGGGKSLCFQVPSLMQEGICLVVTPLIALIKDQTRRLETMGIPVLSLHSGMSYPQISRTLKNAAYGNFKFLYLSPERLQSEGFQEYLPILPLNLIAIDEAHC